MTRRARRPLRRPREAIPVSRARTRLFELVEGVISGVTPRVTLSHRGSTNRVVLVRADELAGLEADLARLRVQVEPPVRPLRGLITLHGDIERILGRLRDDQKKRGRAKLASVLADD